jgi:hypothetical protein
MFPRCCHPVLPPMKFDRGQFLVRPMAITLLSVLVTFVGCGGGGSAGSDTSQSNSASIQPPQNVQSLVIDSGPANTANVVFTSVTICAPGTQNCQTIDHIQVDTGSSGLRIMSSVLTPLSLFQQKDTNGNPIVECTQFVDGYVWGPLKVADVTIAGEKANAVPIQLIGDPAFVAVPNSCSSSGPAENTVGTFGANGILGIGVFQQDCGAACALSAIPGTYYICPNSGCQTTAISLTQQIQNPVALFATDNNGAIIELPSIPSSGAATVSGSLIFGIGTQANNGLGAATVLTVDPNTGNFDTRSNGQSYSNSFIDSGSTAIFFPDGSTPVCTGPGSGLYCPNATQNISTLNQGINAAISTVNFSVANADALLGNNRSFTAFNNLAGPNPDPNSFDWGLPFFFGRHIFTAIEGRNTTVGTGPYVAY